MASLIITYNPSIVKANKALYMRQIMIPASFFQCSMLHQWVKVPCAHHESKPKPRPQMARSRALEKRLRREFRPQQQ